MCTFVCVLMYAFVYVLVLHPFIFPSDGARAQIYALNAKLTKLTLQIGCPSNHLPSVGDHP